MISDTYKLRDCFAVLAMTALAIFYGFIKVEIFKLLKPNKANFVPIN